MTDFKAKMQRIRFLLGSRGSMQHSPTPTVADAGTGRLAAVSTHWTNVGVGSGCEKQSASRTRATII